MSQQTQQPVTPFLALVLVIVVGAAWAVGRSPVGAGMGAIYEALAMTLATWIGA